MNTQEVYSLLEKYYEGTASEAEELELKRYFRENTVPPELEHEKEIFGWYGSELTIPEPSAGFEQRIISAVGKAQSRPTAKVRRMFALAMSSAAAILILAGSWFFFIHQSEPADTFKDPAIAYNETMKILYGVSEKMNSGMKVMQPATRARSVAGKSMEKVERSTGIINDNLKTLGYFRKAMNIVSSPLETRSLK